MEEAEEAEEAEPKHPSPDEFRAVFRERVIYEA